MYILHECQRIMTLLRKKIFNYKFVTEPDNDLKCGICLEVAKDPTQHGKCGKLFCSECIDKYGNMPCPNCRSENPQSFADGKSKLIKLLIILKKKINIKIE